MTAVWSLNRRQARGLNRLPGRQRQLAELLLFGQQQLERQIRLQLLQAKQHHQPPSLLLRLLLHHRCLQTLVLRIGERSTNVLLSVLHDTPGMASDVAGDYAGASEAGCPQDCGAERSSTCC